MLDREPKVGDIVQMRSGGTKMTVSEVLEDGEVVCIWNDCGVFGREILPMTVLEKEEKGQWRLSAQGY